MIRDRADAPTGEVTFFFTDVEGSTGLWERDPDAMEAALAEHDRRLRQAIGDQNGYVFTTAGDSFAVAFATPTEALNAAIQAQLLLLEPCADLVLRVRMGLHTGTATGREGDYFGAVVNRCARLEAAGHGGQVLLSGTTAALVRPHLDPEVELVDAGEHRLKDLLRPEHIFQVRHPRLDDHFPPLRTLDGPWSNLPTQLTSFVGRSTELDDVGELLRANRLVTLIGSGGSGKTRLALQAAADSVDDFPQGVRLVELASVSDPPLVLDEVATTFGAQAAPGVPLADTIAARIGSQRMLLIVDNCEHLLSPVQQLAEHLLRQCPALTILATSRERLGAIGEATYAVPALSLPSESDLSTAQDSGSVQLFAERALLAKPDFEINADNIGAVVSICRQLDGIPLALELAAARVRVLSPAQIDDRLTDRFRLLGTTARGAVERHRTLAATIDWSYDQLSPPEQAVFRRSSIFAGNFSLEAAEAVCTGGLVDEFDVLDFITALVDKSMLVPEEIDGGDMRYRLLESMRHYGSSRRADEPDGDTSAERHVAHFVEVAEVLQATERAGRVGDALTELTHDADNIRAALRFALDHRRLSDAARIIGAVGYLWYASGAFREGVEWCRELFETEPELPDEVLAAALHAYSLLEGSWAQPQVGAEMLQREVEIRRRIGDPARLAAALNNLGSLQNDLGRPTDAEATLREAIDEYHAANQPTTLARASLAYVYRDLGRYDDSAELFAEALAEASTADDAYGVALATGGLGESALHRGRLDEARRLIEASQAGFQGLGVAPGVAYADLLLALAATIEGDRADAATRLRAALVDADVHWYLAAKFWIIQLTAGLIDDRAVAAELLGVAQHHYDGADQAQPEWVLEHLTATQDAVRDELGKNDYDLHRERGRLITQEVALQMVDGALQAVIETAPESTKGQP